MPLHSLELTLDDASAALVRHRWQALMEAGLPSQARHTGATNAPHVTVASASVIAREAERRSVEDIGTQLPLTLPVAGHVVLGTHRLALALLLAAPESLVAAVATTRATLPRLSAPWVPHVTLARRLTPAQVGDALEVLATLPSLETVTATRLRRWDPDTREVRTLTPASCRAHEAGAAGAPYGDGDGAPGSSESPAHPEESV